MAIIDCYMTAFSLAEASKIMLFSNFRYGVAKLRWRSTVIAKTDGSVSIPQDDWCFGNDAGTICARIVRSHQFSVTNYVWSVYLADISYNLVIGSGNSLSRNQALAACQKKLCSLEKYLDT
jgi:hypothetical protein